MPRENNSRSQDLKITTQAFSCPTCGQSANWKSGLQKVWFTRTLICRQVFLGRVGLANKCDSRSLTLDHYAERILRCRKNECGIHYSKTSVLRYTCRATWMLRCVRKHHVPPVHTMPYQSCPHHHNALTHWDLNPGPSDCEVDVIPLHHVPSCTSKCRVLYLYVYV